MTDIFIIKNNCMSFELFKSCVKSRGTERLRYKGTSQRIMFEEFND